MRTAAIHTSDPNPKIGDEVIIVSVDYDKESGRFTVDLERLAGEVGEILKIHKTSTQMGSVPSGTLLYHIRMHTPEGVEFWASREMFKPVTSETYDEQKRWCSGGARFKVAFRGQLFEVTADQLVFEDDVLIDIKPPFRAENVTAALEAQLNAAPRPERARRYLPTLSDLVDRMVIVQLKALFIPERRAEYLAERELIEHDVDLILAEGDATGERVTAADVHAIIAIALTNHMIWINESRARAGGNEQDKLLKLTHSLNGQRNLAKNKLARMDKGRHDHKADCFAAELVEEFGHLQIF
jgi:hypothetical protein